MIVKIDSARMSNLISNAQESERKRKNHNFHSDYDDPINRMLYAIEPFSYIRPHKHENPDKREVFIILRGKIAVVFFKPNGDISEHVCLDQNLGNYGVEIPAGTWHTLISLESGTVVYEIIDGPYLPMDAENIAPWAPAEGDSDCQIYLQKICDELKLT